MPAASKLSAETPQHRADRWARMETIDDPLIASPNTLIEGSGVPRHKHNRSQLLYAVDGVVMVSTDAGRWMVPPDHGMWIPAGVEHWVEILGRVAIHSVYVRPESAPGAPAELQVVTLPDFVRTLIVELTGEAASATDDRRFSLLAGLLLYEVPRLREMPLALPLPRDSRLAELCRSFLRQPSSHTTIEGWAGRLGMSRRSFTRVFQRETGISLSTWRQQACLFAALPRLAEGQPITRVAMDLGYESVPAFTTMFRRMTGSSPSRYLQKSG